LVKGLKPSFSYSVSRFSVIPDLRRPRTHRNPTALARSSCSTRRLRQPYRMSRPRRSSKTCDPSAWRPLLSWSGWPGRRCSPAPGTGCRRGRPATRGRDARAGCRSREWRSPSRRHRSRARVAQHKPWRTPTLLCCVRLTSVWVRWRWRLDGGEAMDGRDCEGACL
jgi:hypothetical protein